MNPIGLTLPLQIGRNGYFEQSYDTLTQVKANITNLLRTKKGERRMNPNFGSGLQEYLFEQSITESSDILIQIITDEINNYIPGVIVNKVDIGLSNQEKNKLIDSYILYIKIQFTINNQTDVINLTVNQNNI
jgi:phage baseplate assembly protein W